MYARMTDINNRVWNGAGQTAGATRGDIVARACTVMQPVVYALSSDCPAIVPLPCFTRHAARVLSSRVARVANADRTSCPVEFTPFEATLAYWLRTCNEEILLFGQMPRIRTPVKSDFPFLQGNLTERKLCSEFNELIVPSAVTCLDYDYHYCCKFF